MAHEQHTWSDTPLFSPTTSTMNPTSIPSYRNSKTSVDWSKIPTFLATWQNPITDAEQEMLTRAGKLEATRLGVDIAQRYRGLRTPEKIWTSTAERTVKSAKALAAGLANDASDVQVIQVSEREEESANSLTPYESCSAYSSSAGNDQAVVFPFLPFPLLSNMITGNTNQSTLSQ